VCDCADGVFDECGVCAGLGLSKDCNGTCDPANDASADNTCTAPNGYNPLTGVCTFYLSSCQEETADGASPGDSTSSTTISTRISATTGRSC
jgi:hypothetical protein